MAMNVSQIQCAVDPENKYGFPATCYGYIPIAVDESRTVLLVWGSGAPSTNYNNAPNGSLYTDLTNYKLYIKTGASTWTLVGAQT